MTYQVLFRPQALAELLEAKDWYEENKPGLGGEFVDAVVSAIDRLADTPLAFPKVHGEIRRIVLRRFPYGIYFRVLETEIVVLGVIHGRRDPRRWQSK